MLKLLYLVPKNSLSRLVGWLVRIEQPGWLAQLSVKIFVRVYGVDLSDAEKNVHEYACIGQLFTRKLKPGSRTIDAEPVCPVDGVLRSVEHVKAGTLIQVKGIQYRIDDLLQSPSFTKRFENGSAANFYLTPKDYHHVHAPVAGEVVGVTHVPGTLWPVNDWSLQSIPDLFCINERLVVYLQSSMGLCAVVLVGATNVGKISLSFCEIQTNRAGQSREIRNVGYDRPVTLTTGKLLGSFEMGSSVIVLFEQSGSLTEQSAVRRVKYGQKINSNS